MKKKILILLFFCITLQNQQVITMETECNLGSCWKAALTLFCGALIFTNLNPDPILSIPTLDKAINDLEEYPHINLVNCQEISISSGEAATESIRIEFEYNYEALPECSDITQSSKITKMAKNYQKMCSPICQSKNDKIRWRCPKHERLLKTHAEFILEDEDNDSTYLSFHKDSKYDPNTAFTNEELTYKFIKFNSPPSRFIKPKAQESKKKIYFSCMTTKPN